MRLLLDELRRQRMLLRLRREEIDARMDRGEYVDPAEYQALLDELEDIKATVESWIFVLRVMEGRVPHEHD